MFTLKQNGNVYDQFDSLHTAIELAEGLFEMYRSQDNTIFTIEKNDVILASLTNRRIIGQFVKQQWRGNHAVTLDEPEEFDATAHIMSLALSDVKGLIDNSANTDEVGLKHIHWSGPHEVGITDSICEFFGVQLLADITPSHFYFVKNKFDQVEPKDEIVTLSVKLNLKVLPGSDLPSFLRNLQLSCASSDSGITITSTDIVNPVKAIPT